MVYGHRNICVYHLRNWVEVVVVAAVVVVVVVVVVLVVLVVVVAAAKSKGWAVDWKLAGAGTR